MLPGLDESPNVMELPTTMLFANDRVISSGPDEESVPPLRAKAPVPKARLLPATKVPCESVVPPV